MAITRATGNGVKIDKNVFDLHGEDKQKIENH